MKKNRFDSKVVIVIGATGGIGEAVCKRLAEEEAKLILFSRNGEKLKNLKIAAKIRIRLLLKAMQLIIMIWKMQ